MNYKEFISAYWNDVITKNKSALPKHFNSDAAIICHNNNKSFTLSEFIKTNCKNPGNWSGTIERFVQMDKLLITITKIWNSENKTAYHVTSFIEINNEKISKVNEYWGKDCPVSEFRNPKNL